MDLLVDCLDGVAGVGVDVLGLIAEVDGAGRGVGGRERVRLPAGDAVDGRVQGLHPAEHVVERPVLLDQDHHGLDPVHRAPPLLGHLVRVNLCAWKTRSSTYTCFKIVRNERGVSMLYK